MLAVEREAIGGNPHLVPGGEREYDRVVDLEAFLLTERKRRVRRDFDAIPPLEALGILMKDQHVQARHIAGDLALSAIRCQFVLIGSQKLQRICSAALLAFDAIAESFIGCAEFACGFDSRRLTFGGPIYLLSPDLNQFWTRVNFTPPVFRAGVRPGQLKKTADGFPMSR